MLLLGYSAEMFLKAALAKAYFGCSEQMFDRALRRLGHDLKRLAKEVSFDGTDADRKRLVVLSRMVRSDARYPLNPIKGISLTQQKADRANAFWHKGEFTQSRQLVLRIKAYASRIDEDRHDPMSAGSFNIDDDGYIVYRTGGGLPPRVTYRFSTAQITSSENTAEAMGLIVPGSGSVLLARLWGTARHIEDKPLDALPSSTNDD